MLRNNKKKKIREKKNLLIANMGDVVVIKNRSRVGGAILGALTTAFCLAVLFMLRAAWRLPIFWIAFAFILLGNVYSLANSVCGRIVLRAKNLTMTVYGPFKKEYKFSDINYVDLKASKPNDGYVTNSVMIYIGDGRKCVKIDTLSRSQADELVSLFRGMLDNAAMEYPEGNEEPFDFGDDEEKKQGGILGKLFKKKDAKAEDDAQEGDAFKKNDAKSDKSDEGEGDAQEGDAQEGDAQEGEPHDNNESTDNENGEKES